jgi:hypothetical protein
MRATNPRWDHTVCFWTLIEQTSTACSCCGEWSVHRCNLCAPVRQCFLLSVCYCIIKIYIFLMFFKKGKHCERCSGRRVRVHAAPPIARTWFAVVVAPCPHPRLEIASMFLAKLTLPGGLFAANRPNLVIRDDFCRDFNLIFNIFLPKHWSELLPAHHRN